MDTTYLSKTRYTAEETQFYRPSTNLDQSGLSQNRSIKDQGFYSQVFPHRI